MEHLRAKQIVFFGSILAISDDVLNSPKNLGDMADITFADIAASYSCSITCFKMEEDFL